MKITTLLFAGLILLTIKTQAQTVTDFDGNEYHTIKIGTQVWMVENLKVAHYNNGDLIGTTNPATLNIASESTPKYQWAYNANESNGAIYGRLYTWYTVIDSRNICPIGWHVPTDAEWTTLTTYLGGESDAGYKLKETGTTHWASTNSSVTNESGFTALPGGIRDPDGHFDLIGSRGIYWSSTEYNSNTAFERRMYYDAGNVYRSSVAKINGSSVRCLQGNATTQINEINCQEEMKIYPNPSNDRVYINCNERKNLKMQIYNIIGECVLQKELNSGTNEIDVSPLSTGIYVFQLTGAGMTIQQKIIKE